MARTGYLQDSNGGGVKSTVEQVSRFRAVNFHSNLSFNYMRNRLGGYLAKLRQWPRALPRCVLRGKCLVWWPSVGVVRFEMESWQPERSVGVGLAIAMFCMRTYARSQSSPETRDRNLE
jgi:hypothetical protein